MEKTVEKIAVIGASANKSKYGNIIMNDLMAKGYKVFPVHPSLHSIDGHRVYNSVSDLEEKPDLFVFVVPGSVGLKITQQLYDKGHRKFWYQPGAHNQEIIDYLKADHSVKFSTISCIMVQTKKQGDFRF